jgi:hypothetical protein
LTVQAFVAVNPDYSHPRIQWLFCSPFVRWGARGMIDARTAPFPL